MGATGFACPRPVAAFLVLASFLVSFAPQTARSDDLEKCEADPRRDLIL